jgi:UDP-N-acetylmuramoyl-L-alanyl-D-glutamate--2,6-diaminopimelate ligase
MKLEELLKGLEGVRVIGDPSVEIRDLAYDSRKVGPGALFFAVPGLHVNGTSFAAESLRRGAAAVLGPPGLSKIGGGVVVEAPDVRQAMAQIATRFFGMPSRELALVGVTGTNGKTTFTYLLESILKQAGGRPGVMGTVSYRYGDRTQRPPNTTPESVDLQRMLREMVAAGCTHALLEVSSHGLDYRRVDGCDFSCAAFTMLGRDHLDHHRDMETYYLAKARLFTEILPRSACKNRVAVLNRDDPYGRRLRDLCPVPAVTVGREGPADYRLESGSVTREGISLRVRTPRGERALESRLLGGVNALNILLAVAVADQLGVDPEAIARGVSALEAVPGRLERVAEDAGRLALVDYAHTPDALDNVLASLRKLTPGRLITVFGCGGDRDRGKRPLMGTAAARWSDLVVVTSDNPRSESPERIVQEIRQGIDALGVPQREAALATAVKRGEKAYTVQMDRREAIGLAVRAAGPGDTVIVAGKGHEDHQILGDRRIPFRDVEEVLRALGESREKESAVE